MLAAPDSIAPGDVRCGILVQGPAEPDWASACVKKLRDLCGTDNLFYLSSHDQNLSQTISQLQLDFVLNLSAQPPKDWTAQLSYGAWSFHFGNEDRGNLSDNVAQCGIYELWHASPTQEVRLVAISPGAGNRILKRGKFKSVLHSLKKHRESILSQCSDWPVYLAQELMTNGKLRGHSESYIGARPAPRFAGHFRFLPLVLGKRKLFLLAERLRKLFLYSQWNIGQVREGLPALLANQSSLAVDWLLDLKWPLFYADPFLTTQNGKTFVFAERYDFTQGKGVIAVLPAELPPGRKIDDSDREEAMNFPFHTSYPCVINDDEQLYCVPETLDREEIAIYRCVEFPKVWQKDTVVNAGGKYSDPTLFKHGSHWWIFATAFDEHSGGNSLLFAWCAPQMGGPWRAHAQNPIKCDVTGARSAGNIFSIGEGLYRPSQDCSQSYGQSIVIQKVLKLTPYDFKEETFHRVSPPHGYEKSSHHMSLLDGAIFIDGRREFFSVLAMTYGLRRLKDRWVNRFRRAQPAKKLPRLRLENNLAPRPATI